LGRELSLRDLPPTQRGLLIGDVKASPFTMHIVLGVDPSGTKLAYFTYLCGTGRAPTTVRGIPIDSTGHFKYTKATGSQWIWKIAGRFISSTQAFVSVLLGSSSQR
jgi:hypothetical protein